MTPEAFEALTARYRTDHDFRDRIDAADSADEAIRIAADSGFDATASDIARLTGSNVELSAEMLDTMSGGDSLESILKGGGVPGLNYTFN